MQFSICTLLSAALVGLASAYTQPVGANPSGNPIVLPGLNQIVPAGTPFTVQWTPTTAGTVTILLLQGPSTDVVPLYPIASSIANSGTFSWTPSDSLVPQSTHYGLQLIVDATGQYQYSTQFGISNPAYSSSSSSSYSTAGHPVSQISDGQVQAPSASTAAANATYFTTSGSGALTTSATYGASATSLTSAASIASANSTLPTYQTTSVASTGIPIESSIVSPSVNMTVPATLKTKTSAIANLTSTSTQLVASSTEASSTSAEASSVASSTSAPQATAAAGQMVVNVAGVMAGLGAFALLI
ncbi:hypothetical protein MMC12_006335 [Toensbergia leucococca]|nr:hypothetical protein [Toensbergia leucococca]